MAESQENQQQLQEFDDDQALLQHILSKKPAEKIIAVPEWDVRLLCRALNAETRILVQMQAYNEKERRTDFRTAFPTILIAGCFNPKTGHKVFTESHRSTLLREQDGAPVERVALAILQLSGLLQTDVDRTKKN